MLPRGTGAGALVHRAMACLFVAAVLWLGGLTGVAAAQDSPGPPTSEELLFVHVCDDGMPDKWEVIEQGSSLGENVVVCNFTAAVEGDPVKAFDTLPASITLFAPEDSVTGIPENINVRAAGVAVTVEYFCTVEEAADRWEGLSGSTRDTEVPGTRTPDRVVLEEGRIASTEEGRERGLIESIFMPGLFTLQEKSFLRLNDQTIATVVINTNSRSISVRDDKNEAGIADALTRTVSANHTPPATPGCTIPAVARPAGDTSTGTANPGGGGGGGGKIGIVLGTGAAITVGGLVVWRRKPGRRPPPPPQLDQPVPPECAGQLKQYEHVRERLLTLEEAFQDMNEHLEAAQKKHHHNLLRTYTIMGWEIGTAIGGPAAGAYKMRPSGRRIVPRQADHWKPPLGLDPRIAAALEQAQSVIAAASARVAALRKHLADIASGVATHPAVLVAQKKLTALGNAVMKYSDDLAKCNGIRSKLDAADGALKAASDELYTRRQSMWDIEKKLKMQQGFAQGIADDLAKVQQKKGTMAIPAPGAAAPGANKNTINVKQPAAPAAVTPAMDPDVLAHKQNQLARWQKDVADSTAELEAARKLVASQEGVENRLKSVRDAHLRDLNQHGDVSQAGVDRLREQHRQARAELEAAKQDALGDIAARQAAAQEALRKAEIEESVAKTFADGLRNGVINGAVQAPGVARQVLHGGVWVASLPFTPILWAFEKGFGRVESVPEAFEILRRGEERIEQLTTQLVMVERAITQQKVVAQRQRQMLDECIRQQQQASKNQAAAA